MNIPVLIYLKYYDKDHEKLAEIIFLTKYKGWEYEAEWRIIRHPEGAGSERFDPKCLSGIILGCEANDKTSYKGYGS